MTALSITRVEPCKGETVTSNHPDWQEHIRYSSDNWMTLMGSSWEYEYDCGDLEAAYQLYKSRNK